MVQSINTKALLALASVVRRPTLLVPHVAVENMSQVNYTALKEICHVKAILFDKDNTITSPYASEIHPAAADGLREARRVFGDDNVAILSNSAGTRDDPDHEDALKIERDLNIAVIRHDEKKPGGLEQVLRHFRLEDPSELCMVGDRLLTDVLFGNLYGLLTVHTLPICDDVSRDNTIARIVRRIENAGLYNDWFGGRYLRRKGAPTHKYWNDASTRIHQGEHPLILSRAAVEAATRDADQVPPDGATPPIIDANKAAESQEGECANTSVESSIVQDEQPKTAREDSASNDIQR